METLFEGKKRIEIGVEGDCTVERLIDDLRRNHLREKEEMFVQGVSVRPGIIVLVNDTDWELLDTTRCLLKDGDTVAFISTLHGG